MSTTYKDRLIKKSETYSRLPGPEAWQKLESRLTNHKRQKTLLKVKYMAAAAAVVMLLSFVFLLKNVENPLSGDGSAALSAFSLENMVTEKDGGIYDVGKLSDLRRAYTKIQMKHSY